MPLTRPKHVQPVVWLEDGVEVAERESDEGGEARIQQHFVVGQAHRFEVSIVVLDADLEVVSQRHLEEDCEGDWRRSE